MTKQKTPNQKRCEDCIYLVEKNGIGFCTECFNQRIEDIDDCPEGIELEEIEKINQTAKENPVKNIAQSERKKEKKPRERKPDVEKEQIITETAEFLQKIAENVQITNVSKLIEFNIGENHYKFDLIRQRKPKK